jgi:hypothetical protein
MIISDFNFLWAILCPNEANSILIINTNTMLPGSITL